MADVPMWKYNAENMEVNDVDAQGSDSWIADVIDGRNGPLIAAAPAMFALLKAFPEYEQTPEKLGQWYARVEAVLGKIGVWPGPTEEQRS